MRECVLRKSEGEMGGEEEGGGGVEEGGGGGRGGGEGGGGGGGGGKGRVEQCWANLEEFLPHGAATRSDSTRN